jgi:putative cell wall-binding protein
MATKDVLAEAIEKLKKNTEKLRKKQASANEDEKLAIEQKIARNESMILDYQFRLKNE